MKFRLNCQDEKIDVRVAFVCRSAGLFLSCKKYQWRRLVKTNELFIVPPCLTAWLNCLYSFASICNIQRLSFIDCGWGGVTWNTHTHTTLTNDIAIMNYISGIGSQFNQTAKKQRHNLDNIDWHRVERCVKSCLAFVIADPQYIIFFDSILYLPLLVEYIYCIHVPFCYQRLFRGEKILHKTLWTLQDFPVNFLL